MHSKESIALTDIDKELTQLWRSMEGGNRVRACLFNLVVYSQYGESRETFQTLFDLVTSKYPCRVIHIQLDSSATKEYLNASVRAENIGSGNQAVSCDQILITCSPSQIQKVPFLVTRHLVPDLPIYLLWGQDPTTEPHIFPQLEKFSTRCVFDPSDAQDLPAFTQRMLHHLDVSPKELLDLNWARLSSWRALFQQTFHSQQLIEELSQTSQLTLTFCPDPSQGDSPSFQALYLQAWLGSRLQWKPQKLQRTDSEWTLSATRPSGALTISLRPDPSLSLLPGQLSSVELTSQSGAHTSMKRISNSQQLEIQRSSTEKCEVPYTVQLNPLTRHHSLVREVFYERIGKHYHLMLKVLSQVWK